MAPIIELNITEGPSFTKGPIKKKILEVIKRFPEEEGENMPACLINFFRTFSRLVNVDILNEDDLKPIALYLDDNMAYIAFPYLSCDTLSYMSFGKRESDGGIFSTVKPIEKIPMEINNDAKSFVRDDFESFFKGDPYGFNFIPRNGESILYYLTHIPGGLQKAKEYGIEFQDEAEWSNRLIESSFFEIYENR